MMRRMLCMWGDGLWAEDGLENDTRSARLTIAV
jgi:hypothetical protein